MTILTSTAQDAYNQLLANSSNTFRGIWEIAEDNYLTIAGYSNGSIAMFSSLGALTDFTLEWTAKQLATNGYIFSNLCPVLRYTPGDAGTEGGGNNWALLTYICNYENKVGTLNTRTKEGVTQENVGNGILVNGETYSFKLTRSNSLYTLYQDGVIICQAPDPEPNTPLYLGWYFWYGGTSYPTNFVLQSYTLDGEVYDGANNYLNTDGLIKVWEQISKKYYSKEEINTKLNNAGITSSTSIINMDNYVDLTDTINNSLDGSIIGGYYIADWEPSQDGWLSLNVDSSNTRILVDCILSDTVSIRLFDLNSNYVAFTVPIQKNKRYRITSSRYAFTHVIFMPNI